jgi:glycosyltransferase involved in cell wall biosynthesis
LKLIKELDKKVKTENEKLFVYDTPKDPTYDVIKQLKTKEKRKDIVLVQNNVDTGKGALNAIISGFQAASTKAVLVVMADLSDDLGKADKMFKAYKNGATVVCASRYARGGGQIGGPLIKRLMSRLAGVSLHYIRRIPTHDITNNYRLYDKDFADTLDIESQAGFEIAMEITVKAFIQRKKIVEVPSIWRDRTDGESNFKLWKWLPSYLRWYRYALFTPRQKTTE